MEKAYQAGEPSVKYVFMVMYCPILSCEVILRISSGRQRYVVQFGPMLQVKMQCTESYYYKVVVLNSSKSK